jgi:hypothetical protein
MSDPKPKSQEEIRETFLKHFDLQEDRRQVNLKDQSERQSQRESRKGYGLIAIAGVCLVVVLIWFLVLRR